MLVILGMLARSVVWLRHVAHSSTLLFLFACGSVSMQSIAREGSLAEVRSAVDRRATEAPLLLSHVQELARILLERDLLSLSDPHGPVYLEHVTPCIQPISTTLERLATRGDATGDTARRMLIESGTELSEEEYAEHARSSTPTRRALAAASSIAPEHWSFRRQAFLDMDVRVRRAALGAAARRPTSGDVEALHDVLRRDPDHLVRRRAALALGGLGELGELHRLEDLWPASSVDDRLALAEAWAAAVPVSRPSTERLRRIALEEPGLVGVLVAEHLACKGDAAGRHAALVRLERNLVTGTEQEQRLALRALGRCSTGLDNTFLSLARTAPSRLTQTEAYLLLAVRGRVSDHDHTELLQISRNVDAAALAAARALLLMGETSILPWHRAALGAPSARVRRYAAQTELQVFERTGAQWALADFAKSLLDDALDVRLSLSCLLLAQHSNQRLPDAQDSRTTQR